MPDNYVSRLPKMMIIFLVCELLELLKEVHLTALKSKDNPQDSLDKITETFLKPDNMIHMMVSKALNSIMMEPEEQKLIVEEMVKFEEYYKTDLDDTDSIIASAELDIFLHQIGIKRGEAGNT